MWMVFLKFFAGLLVYNIFSYLTPLQDQAYLVVTIL